MYHPTQIPYQITFHSSQNNLHPLLRHDHTLHLLNPLISISRTVTRRLPGTTRNITPRSAEPTSSASQQTLLLFLLEITINLLLVQTRRLEQRRQEDNEINTQKGELSPKEDDAEEGEVDGDAVDKGAEDGRRADLLGSGVGSKFTAGLDEVLVLGAVGLFV